MIGAGIPVNTGHDAEVTAIVTIIAVVLFLFISFLAYMEYKHGEKRDN